MIKGECWLGISVHFVVSREFSSLFSVQLPPLSFVFSFVDPAPDVSAGLLGLYPFSSRSPIDCDALLLSSVLCPSVHSAQKRWRRLIKVS